MRSLAALLVIEDRGSRLYTHARACTYTYVSRGEVAGESLCKSTYRRVLPFPLRVSFPLPQLSRSRVEGDPLDSSRNMPRPDPPSLSPRLSARARAMLLHTTENRRRTRGCCARVMKSFPAALPRESSLPSTAHAPMNTWHRSQPLAYCVHEILHYAFSKVAVFFVARSLRQPLRTRMKKDDGIISFLCVCVRTYA